MKRRTLVQALIGLPLAAAHLSLSAATRTQADIDAMRSRWRDFLASDFEAPGPDEKVSRDEEQWREQLSPQQFQILREEGTERAFTSALNDEKRSGVFVCAGCDLPLFTSEMKYESGTGWPSFFTTIPNAVATKRDFKLVWPRTEYHCARCGGHQGHIFKDGPAPTRERWCNNGLALKFVPGDAH